MRALIAFLAASVLVLGAAVATPHPRPVPACRTLVSGPGYIFGPAPGSSRYDGLFLGGGIVVWTNPENVETRGTYRCDEGGFSIRLDGSDRDDAVTFRGDVLLWRDLAFGVPAGVLPSATPAPAAVVTAPEPPPFPCKDLPGTTWEIRSLEGLPASADRKTARHPSLIFGNGRGTWIHVGGERESIGWLCDDKGLTITRSGKPLKMPREPGGFRYAESPVRQFLVPTP